MESPANLDNDTGQGGMSSGSESSSRKRPQTVSCFLCGGTQIYPGPRYENHLINEHGVLDIDFMIAITLYKQKHGSNPSLENPIDSKEPSAISNNVKDTPDKKTECSMASCETQTDFDIFCAKCTEPIEDKNIIPKPNPGDGKLRVKNEFKLRIKTNGSQGQNEEDNEEGMDEDDIDEDEERFAAILAAAEDSDDDDDDKNLVMDMDELKGEDEESLSIDKAKRKPVGKQWGPNSFSSTFTCHFCNEQFRKDYKLKLHLMLNHKNEDPEEMAKAKEVLTKAKLDGCVHRCGLCGSKYNSVANFTRHIKDVHQMTRAQYSEEYGSSEVVSRMFKCELCDKEVKHTRNIIGAHMKMVHLISWKEYQEILLKLKQGINVGDLPAPELFDCIICGVSVKYRREHLNKKHQITEEVYDELIAKKNRGEDISEVLPEREIFKCMICERECMDLRKHLERSHQITEEQYEENFRMSSGNVKRVIKQSVTKEDGLNVNTKNALLPIKKDELQQNQHGTPKQDVVTPQNAKTQRLSPNFGGKASPNPISVNGSHTNGNSSLSTDMRCYFGCDEVFKKDYQLHLHLKLKHRNVDQKELMRAYQAADDEIALTRRSGSTFQCAICPKTFNDNGAFYGHIQSKHNMQWKDYKDQYGRCEVESAPFECTICGRVVKYDRNTVHTHLKNVHGITWGIYIDRIRKTRRGEVPDDLPSIETFECKVCNVSVKYLREHLKNVHKITEAEYEELFKDELTKKETNDISINQKEDSLNRSGNQQSAISEKQQVDKNGHIKQSNNSTDSVPDYLAPEINLPKPPKSDIQDKTNKKCSSCSITFDSRRSFIEHCTTVHNMKFRTKSGATISAPTLPQKILQQQNPLKRKAESTDDNQPLQRDQITRPIVKQQDTGHFKRPRNSPAFELEMDNAEHDIGEQYPIHKPLRTTGMQQPVTSVGTGGKRTLYTPAGVSKWNQCRYECCFCKRSTMSRSSMTSHIHNTHGIPIKDYKEQNYPDIEVETNWFQCRLCPARTKFVKDCIAPHLKMSHSMDIDTYERELMQPEDWPYEVVTHPTLSADMSGNALRVSQPRQGNVVTSANNSFQRDRSSSTTASPISSTGSAEYPISLKSKVPVGAKLAGGTGGLDGDKWNRCKYQCCLCDLITLDHRQMRIHIATQHSMQYDEYCRQYGGTEIVSKRFHCDLCNSEMKFCRQNVYAHMKDVHKMTLAEYETKVGMGRNGEYDGEEIAVEAELNTSGIQGNGDDNEEIGGDGDEIIIPGEARTNGSYNLHEVSVPNGNSGTSGILDEGKTPSRWNKCRFRCCLCKKLSSEKRIIREHIIKVHGLTLQDYEGRYGECEIHTEYFFCGVCHAEVKHNLKNISLHLGNVHNMSPSQYELQYGRIPDDEVIIPGFDEGGDMDMSQMDDASGIDDSMGGFGAHFLLTNGQEGDNGLMQQESRSPHKKLPNPPKTDVTNPKNKYCLPCNRDFNRRQAFVEHCRNVHNMKIKLSKPVAPGALPSVGGSPAKNLYNNGLNNSVSSGNYNCDYCHKGFSSRSNKNRHMLLSCDAKAKGAKPSPQPVTNVPNTIQRNNSQNSNSEKRSSHGGGIRDNDFIYDPQIRPHRQESEQKCPYPECDTVYGRSALLKRHLLEVHNITSAQDISVQLPDLESERKRILIKIKSEPVDPEEMVDDSDKNGTLDAQNDEQDEEEESEQSTREEAQQEKKVPPLRVKLPSMGSPTLTTQSTPKASSENDNLPQEEVISPINQQPGMKSGKDVYNCANCPFKSNNSYIFGRHRKSCNKKRKLLEKEHGNLEPSDYDPNNTNESSLYEGDSEDYVDRSNGALVHEPEDSIEVPVEFDGDNEDVSNMSDASNDKILDVHMDVVAPNQDPEEEGEEDLGEETVNRGSIEEEEEFEDSQGSEEGEELEVGPDDEMEDDNDPSEGRVSAEYGIVSVEDKKGGASDSDHDDEDFGENDDPGSDSEKVEESDIATNVETNGTENDSEDEENSVEEN